MLLHGTWETKLTTRKQTNLKTLRHNSDLWAAFHQLTRYAELWDDGVNLRVVTNLPIAGFKPQLINYLTAILRFWNAFSTDSGDVQTVNHLNLFSTQVYKDRQLILRFYDDGILFTKLDKNGRQRAKNMLLSSRCIMIPTLTSCFSNRT